MIAVTSCSSVGQYVCSRINCNTMKVFVFSARPFDQPGLEAAKGNHQLLYTDKRLTPDTAYLAEGCEAVALFTSDDGSARVLEKLFACGVRYIALRSVGYDHVDLSCAARLGMKVANVPEYSPYSVAEHAVALLMALNRKLIQGQHLISLQDFRIDSLKGFDIHGKTVGVVGTGKIGMAFARIMLGFGAKVLAYDPRVNSEAIELDIRYVSFEELLEKSDIVSLHCPLNSSTRHLLSNAEFARMKKGSIIINTSRGAVINTADLINALDQGKLGGAGLDVYEFEKGLFFEDHRNDVIHDVHYATLRNFNNVIITSHQGFLTSDAINEIARTTISNLDSWENEMHSENELNMGEEKEKKKIVVKRPEQIVSI
jgi:D-lactate dehydrogenase